MLGRVLSGLVKGFAKQRTLMSSARSRHFAVGAGATGVGAEQPGFTPLAVADASMVRVLVTRERLVPTDDPA